VLPVANNARKCEKWDETQTVISQASELQNVSHDEMFAQQQSSLASLEPRPDEQTRASLWVGPGLAYLVRATTQKMRRMNLFYSLRLKQYLWISMRWSSSHTFSCKTAILCSQVKYARRPSKSFQVSTSGDTICSKTDIRHSSSSKPLPRESIRQNKQLRTASP